MKKDLLTIKSQPHQLLWFSWIEHCDMCKIVIKGYEWLHSQNIQILMNQTIVWIVIKFFLLKEERKGK